MGDVEDAENVFRMRPVRNTYSRHTKVSKDASPEMASTSTSSALPDGEDVEGDDGEDDGWIEDGEVPALRQLPDHALGETDSVATADDNDDGFHYDESFLSDDIDNECETTNANDARQVGDVTDIAPVEKRSTLIGNMLSQSIGCSDMQEEVHKGTIVKGDYTSLGNDDSVPPFIARKRQLNCDDVAADIKQKRQNDERQTCEEANATTNDSVSVTSLDKDRTVTITKLLTKNSGKKIDLKICRDEERLDSLLTYGKGFTKNVTSTYGRRAQRKRLNVEEPSEQTKKPADSNTTSVSKCGAAHITGNDTVNYGAGSKNPVASTSGKRTPCEGLNVGEQSENTKKLADSKSTYMSVEDYVKTLKSLMKNKNMQSVILRGSKQIIADVTREINRLPSIAAGSTGNAGDQVAFVSGNTGNATVASTSESQSQIESVTKSTTKTDNTATKEIANEDGTDNTMYSKSCVPGTAEGSANDSVSKQSPGDPSSQGNVLVLFKSPVQPNASKGSETSKDNMLSTVTIPGDMQVENPQVRNMLTAMASPTYPLHRQVATNFARDIRPNQQPETKAPPSVGNKTDPPASKSLESVYYYLRGADGKKRLLRVPGGIDFKSLLQKCGGQGTAKSALPTDTSASAVHAGAHGIVRKMSSLPTSQFKAEDLHVCSKNTNNIEQNKGAGAQVGVVVCTKHCNREKKESSATCGCQMEAPASAVTPRRSGRQRTPTRPYSPPHTRRKKTPPKPLATSPTTTTPSLPPSPPLSNSSSLATAKLPVVAVPFHALQQLSPSLSPSAWTRPILPKVAPDLTQPVAPSPYSAPSLQLANSPLFTAVPFQNAVSIASALPTTNSLPLSDTLPLPTQSSLANSQPISKTPSHTTIPPPATVATTPQLVSMPPTTVAIMSQLLSQPRAAVATTPQLVSTPSATATNTSQDVSTPPATVATTPQLVSTPSATVSTQSQLVSKTPPVILGTTPELAIARAPVATPPMTNIANPSPQSQGNASHSPESCAEPAMPRLHIETGANNAPKIRKLKMPVLQSQESLLAMLLSSKGPLIDFIKTEPPSDDECEEPALASGASRWPKDTEQHSETPGNIAIKSEPCSEDEGSTDVPTSSDEDDDHSPISPYVKMEEEPSIPSATQTFAELPKMSETEHLSRVDRMRMLQKHLEEQERVLAEAKRQREQQIKERESNPYLEDLY